MDFSKETLLYKEIKAGNEKAFEYLYKRYYYRLKGFAMGYIQDEDIVDDLIQECFLSLWEKHDKLKMISLSSLLFTMVRNACLNYLKHESVKTKHLAKEFSLSEIEERMYLADFGVDPSGVLLYEELNNQVEEVLKQLPERCLEVFSLSRNEGLKNREIAEKLSISTTAVEKHLRKALSAFTIHFKEKYPIDNITYFFCMVFPLFF